MATNLIKEVIRIFFFRTMVQGPIVEYLWFKHGSSIDPKIMEGRWENEENEGRGGKLRDPQPRLQPRGHFSRRERSGIAAESVKDSVVSKLLHPR